MSTLSKGEVLRRIVGIGLIAVIRVQSSELAVRAVAAVRKGGLRIAEITMTVPGATKIIEELRSDAGEDSLIGAGTVLNVNVAKQCIQSGAQFIVSAVLDPATVTLCNDKSVVVIPGALTPNEIINAWTLGADFVKVFPVDSMGGASYIKSLKGPLPHVKLVPTGGVSLKTARAFIEAGAEALGVGSDLVSSAALRDGRDEQIVERTLQLVEIVKQAKNCSPTTL